MPLFRGGFLFRSFLGETFFFLLLTWKGDILLIPILGVPVVGNISLRRCFSFRGKSDRKSVV